MQTVNNTCDILTKALDRYERLLTSLGNFGIHMQSKTKFHHGHHNTVDGSNQFRSFRNDRNFEVYTLEFLSHTQLTQFCYFYI